MIFRKYILPGLSFLGFCFAVWTTVQYARPVPAAQPAAQPPRPQYERKVAGAGIVEAATRNIEVGSHMSGVVAQVAAKVGDKVSAGQPLFALDERSARAELAVRRAALAQAEAEVLRQEARPRPEEVPALKAQVADAEAQFSDARARLERAENIKDGRAISQEDLKDRRFSMQSAQARLNRARADLALLLAGAWKQDLAVARAQAEAARAQVQAAAVNLELHTVAASVDGEVLQVNVRPGEFAQAGRLPEPLVLLGRTSRLHVRVDIDENDAWRFDKAAPAVAFVRGNAKLSAPLSFEYMEPYVVPKRSLTGGATERTDTRVLQVVYSFDPAAMPVNAGQLLDVFVEDRQPEQPKAGAAAQGGQG